MKVKIEKDIDRKKIVKELNKREGEKNIPFENAYKQGKDFINNLGK
ncbi:MAG: hypothetical protein QM490_00485 [Candidatus Gracilibacteria bacterium]